MPTLTATGLYTRTEAGALLNVTREAVLRLVRAGRLTTVRVGKRDLITGVSIAQFTGAELPYVPARPEARPRTVDEIMAELRRTKFAAPVRV